MAPSFASSSDTQLSKLVENHLTFQREYQCLEDRFTLLESKIENPGSPSSTHASKHYMKLEIPRFDGNDPLRWIFKITQYFEYRKTLISQNTNSENMEGEALS